MISIAQFGQAEFVDGSQVSVCLTAVDSLWPICFFAVSITVFFVLPLGVLIVLYTVIARHLMANPGLTSHGQRSNVLRYRKQVILMLGAVVASFFVCLAPFRALTVWIIVVPAESIVALGIEGYYSLLYFCRIMLYLNSAMNPILYNLMSSKFREGFVRLLCCQSPGGAGRKAGKQRTGSRPGRAGTFHTTSTNLSGSQSGAERQRSKNGGGAAASSSSASTASVRRYRSAAAAASAVSSTGGDTSDSDVPDRECAGAPPSTRSVVAAAIVRHQQQFADIVESHDDVDHVGDGGGDGSDDDDDEQEQEQETKARPARRPSAAYILQYAKSLQPTTVRRKSTTHTTRSVPPEIEVDDNDDTTSAGGGDIDERRQIDCQASIGEIIASCPAVGNDDANASGDAADDAEDDAELCQRFLREGRWNFESLV